MAKLLKYKKSIKQKKKTVLKNPIEKSRQVDKIESSFYEGLHIFSNPNNMSGFPDNGNSDTSWNKQERTEDMLREQPDSLFHSIIFKVIKI